MKNPTKKRMLIVLLTIALVAVLTVGGTLAYLNVVSTPLNNKFTFVGTGTGGMKAETKEVFNPADAQNVVPGRKIIKQPYVENTSDIDIGEWAAIRASFVYPTGHANAGTVLSDADFEIVKRVITVNTWGTDWVNEAGTAAATQKTGIYFYNTLLKKSAKTTNLFDSVTINPTATTADINALVTMKGFEIKIEGAVIQAEGFNDIAAAKPTLSALFS